MRINFFAISFIFFIIFNCNTIKAKSNNKHLYIQDFKVFFEKLKIAVENKDTQTILLLASDTFRYDTPLDEEKYNYSREEAIENFDFELVNKLLSEGYVLEENNKSAYSPPLEKMKKYGYAIWFWNDGKGWLISSIYSGE